MTELRQRPAPGMIYIERRVRDDDGGAALLQRRRRGGGERPNKCSVLKG